MLVGHYNILVKFEYQGQGVKVKVMVTKKQTFSLILDDTFQTKWPINLNFGMLPYLGQVWVLSS